MSVSRFIFISCFIVHMQLVFSSTWTLNLAGSKYETLAFNVIVGISYLLYPSIGWIAEVYLSNLTMIKWSFVTGLISSLLGILTATILMTVPPYFTGGYLHAVCGMLFLMTGLAGLGMFEANAIQFGIDQMLEASSEQLSSFIHWYFWFVHLGPLFIFYVMVGICLYVRQCRMKASLFGVGLNFSIGLMLFAITIIQLISLILVILCMKCSKFFFLMERRSRNSLLIIYKVLKYAYLNKYPERRSAFTYWENDIPSRIDLGKQKYGGPFTFEEVEDVKTFFMLLLLLLSLFGFHLSGDGYSLTFFMMNRSGCTTIIPLIMITLNPQHIQYFVVIVGVPMFQLFKKHLLYYTPDMLIRLWIGLVLALLNEAIQTTYSLLIPQREFDCHQIGNSNFKDFSPSLLLQCVFANTFLVMNDSCDCVCSDPPVDFPSVYISILPLLCYGASYLFVFMTALEFICAQSPNDLKGLVIGIWYSLLSIKFILINVLDTYPPYLELIPWNIYHGIKGFCIFISIIAFSIVYKHYRYRQRNEVVNEQAIIEELFERELLLNNTIND